MDNEFLKHQSAIAWINQQDLSNKTPEDVYSLLKETISRLDEKYPNPKPGFSPWDK